MFCKNGAQLWCACPDMSPTLATTYLTCMNAEGAELMQARAECTWCSAGVAAVTLNKLPNAVVGTRRTTPRLNTHKYTQTKCISSTSTNRNSYAGAMFVCLAAV